MICVVYLLLNQTPATMKLPHTTSPSTTPTTTTMRWSLEPARVRVCVMEQPNPNQGAVLQRWAAQMYFVLFP